MTKFTLHTILEGLAIIVLVLAFIALIFTTSAKQVKIEQKSDTEDMLQIPVTVLYKK